MGYDPAQGVSVVWTVLVSLVWSACPEPTTGEVVEARLTDAETAYVALDVDGFQRSLDRAAMDLGCLGEPATVVLAGHYHRLVGLAAYVRGDEAAALQAFGAARQLEPDRTLSHDLVPEGHELHALYEALRVDGGATASVRPARSGHMAFDGEQGLARPADRPTLWQVIGPDGTVGETAYLWPDDPMPPYASRAPRQRVFQQVAVGLGAGALVAVGVSAGANAKFHGDGYEPDDPDGNLSKLERRQQLTNGATVASAGLAGLAATSLAVGFILRE